MQPCPRYLLVTGATAAWMALALCSCGHPYGSTKIVDGRNVPAANRYSEEFAASLKVTTHWSTGEPLNEPFFYLPSAPELLVSPDGALSLTQRYNLEDGYSTLTLLRRGSQRAETVLVIQEADQGSGTSHAYQWSRDSKAVFIYGSGRPAGQSFLRNAALVYLVDQKVLYSVDFAPLLAERLKHAKK